MEHKRRRGSLGSESSTSHAGSISSRPHDLDDLLEDDDGTADSRPLLQSVALPDSSAIKGQGSHSNKRDKLSSVHESDSEDLVFDDERDIPNEDDPLCAYDAMAHADSAYRRKASVHIDPDAFRRMSINNSDLPNLLSEAQNATDAERSMGLWKSLRLYPKAVGWSLLLSTAIVMEGFDVVLLANLFAYPPFQRKFGVLQPDGTYQLTAAWQSGLSNGALVGEILGLFLNGIIAEKIGYRKTMIGALTLVAAFVFIIFFSETLVQLLIGEILIGIPWGVFQTLTTTYAAEVAPTHLRAYLTTVSPSP
jgi:hypothetical protein